MFLLVALLIIVPVVELVVLVQVAHWIGVWEALFLLVAVSLLGAWMVKIQGIGVIRHISDDWRNRRVPARSLVDGALLLMAGTLLLFPGFVTDLVGLVLLVPPVRTGIRNGLIGRWTRKYLPMTVRSRPVQTRPPTGTSAPWGEPPELESGPAE